MATKSVEPGKANRAPQRKARRLRLALQCCCPRPERHAVAPPPREAPHKSPTRPRRWQRTRKDRRSKARDALDDVSEAKALASQPRSFRLSRRSTQSSLIDGEAGRDQGATDKPGPRRSY